MPGCPCCPRLTCPAVPCGAWPLQLSLDECGGLHQSAPVRWGGSVDKATTSCCTSSTHIPYHSRSPLQMHHGAAPDLSTLNPPRSPRAAPDLYIAHQQRVPARLPREVRKCLPVPTRRNHSQGTIPANPPQEDGAPSSPTGLPHHATGHHVCASSANHCAMARAKVP